MAQLEAPPPDVDVVLLRLLGKAAHGPGKWFHLEDVLHLKRAFHIASEFKGVEPMATAARYRVATQDSRAVGGLDVPRRADRLRQALRDSVQIGVCGAWADWFRNSTILQLSDTMTYFHRELRVTQRSLEEEIAQGAPRPWERLVARRVVRSFQRSAASKVPDREFYNAGGRVRCNLGRFGFADRRQAARCLDRLRTLGKSVPPRVWAATFGVIWNRWATCRRRQSTSSWCLFGCPFGEDSVEHYGRCPVVWRFARERLQLRCRFSQPWEYWCLVAPEDFETARSSAWWERLALLHFAVLKVTNAARHRGILAEEEAPRALQQAAIEGARGQSSLTMAWCSCMPRQPRDGTWQDVRTAA